MTTIGEDGCRLGVEDLTGPFGTATAAVVVLFEVAENLRGCALSRFNGAV